MNTHLLATMTRLAADRIPCGQLGFLQVSTLEALGLGLSFDEWAEVVEAVRPGLASATLQKQFRQAEKDHNACLELDGKASAITKWGKPIASQPAPAPVKRVAILASAAVPKAPAEPMKVCRIQQLGGQWEILWDPTPSARPSGILRSAKGASYSALLAQAKAGGFTHVFIGSGGAPAVRIEKA